MAFRDIYMTQYSSVFGNSSIKRNIQMSLKERNVIFFIKQVHHEQVRTATSNVYLLQGK